MQSLTARNKEILEAVERLGSKKAAAKELGLHRSTVQAVCTKAAAIGHNTAMGQEGGAPGIPKNTETAITPGAPQLSGRGDMLSGVVFVERAPKSLEEALEAFAVDLDVWKVKAWSASEWNGLAKLKGADGVETLQVVTLSRIKVDFQRIPGVQSLKAILDGILSSAEKAAPKWRIQITKAKAPAGLLSLNVPDLHVGKLAWAPETGGESYDVAISGRVFRDAVKDLIGKAKRCNWNPAKILFPVGNDFLNTDRMIGGKAGATTKGTFQDEDGRWQRSFLKGFEMAEEAISGIAEAYGVPVEIAIVPGNHDEERIFYLGHALEVAFRHHPLVCIDNRPIVRKYFAFERILIGMSHGDKEPIDQLPLLMAARYPLTEFRTLEHYLGHLHHRRGRSFETHAETGPILVRTFGSLSPSDAWHVAKGYEMSARSAEALFYNGESLFEGSAIHFAA